MTRPIRKAAKIPNKDRWVIGIDPSLTGFALCSLSDRSDEAHFEEYSTKPVGKDATAAQRRERYLSLIDKAVALVRQRNPRLVAVEGYAYGANKSGVWLGELGMLLRDRLLSEDVRLVEISPNTLKKFVTGKGQGSKATIVSHLAARYGMTFKTDNQADAFALARAAYVLEGMDPDALKREVQSLTVVKFDV